MRLQQSVTAEITAPFTAINTFNRTKYSRYYSTYYSNLLLFLYLQAKKDELMGKLVKAWKRERKATVEQVRATNSLAIVLDETAEFLHRVVEAPGDYESRFDKIEVDDELEQERLDVGLNVAEGGEAGVAAGEGGGDDGGAQAQAEVDTDEEMRQEEQRKAEQKEFRKGWNYAEGFKRFAAGNNVRARTFSKSRKVKPLDRISRKALLRTQCKLYVCTFLYCGEVRASEDGITSHCMLHAGKRFKCAVCNKKFRTYGNLRNCTESHKGTHQCPVCDKDLKTKPALVRHKSVHSKSPEIVCIVPGCPKPNIQHKTDKSRHFKSHHQMRNPSKDLFIVTPRNQLEYYTREEYQAMQGEQEEQQQD